MNRSIPWWGLVLTGLAPPAFAADIDEVATSALTMPAALAAPDGTRHRARVTRTTTQHGPGATRTVRTTTVVAGRPAPVRPGGPIRVVHSYPRPAPVVVVGPPRPPVVVYRAPPRPRTVVYVAPPVRTVTYVEPAPIVTYVEPAPVAYVEAAPPAPAELAPAVIEEAPRQGIDRADTLAIGVVGGSLLSTSPVSGELYGDPGLGLVGRYRPAETVGLELGLSHHGGAFSSEDRSQTQAGGQVLLFAYPWTRVSPYLLGGVVYNAANVAGPINEADVLHVIDGQWGLDAGVGVELALGNNFAIDLEGKYIGWLDERYEGEAPGAFQATAGLLYHFR